MSNMINEKDLLRCGEYLTDDAFVKQNVQEHTINSIRIRTIKYEGKIYYHKMVNGDCIECKELK